MILPASGESCSGSVTPEMLAGVYVRVEAEEDLTVRPYQSPRSATHSNANGAARPTADQLAGVYLHVEASEDLTVRTPSERDG